MTHVLLAHLWFGIIAFEIGLYLWLDGTDLGIGLLSLFRKEEDARAPMMQVIGPIWDANETWLVIAGGTLFGAFPMAYGIMLNALYVPVMLLIFGLILRAVSFEFHEYGQAKSAWSRLFGVGSVLAVLGQGFMASGLISGISVENGAFSGGAFDWFTPLTFVLTLVIAVTYLAVGWSYLEYRRNSSVRLNRVRYLFSFSILLAGFVGVTLFMSPDIIPGALTIAEAASSSKTLTFMLWGIGPLIPIVLAYNFYLYVVFKNERAEWRAEKYYE